MMLKDLRPGDMYLLQKSCWIVISVVRDSETALKDTLKVVYMKMWEEEEDDGWRYTQSIS